MRRPIFLLVAALAAAGCTDTKQEVVRDGSGATVERIQHPGYTEEFRITEAGGRVCVAKSVWPMHGKRKSSRETVALSCSDGSSGSAVIEFGSYERYISLRIPATISYQIAGGGSGSVRV